MHEGQYIRARVVSLLEMGDPTVVPTAAFAGEVDILREYLQKHPSEVCYSGTEITKMQYYNAGFLLPASTWFHFPLSVCSSNLGYLLSF